MRILVLDPSLGVARGHHSPLARGFATLLDEPPLFAGADAAAAPEGVRFTGVFRYRIDDAFRVSRYANPLMGNARMAAVAQLTRRFRHRKSVDTNTAVNGKALDEAEFKRIFAPLAAGSALHLALTAAGGAKHVVSVGADPALLCALHDRASLFASLGAPRLHLVFMYPEQDYLGPRTTLAHDKIVRDMLAWPNPPALYAELEEHATDLEARYGVSVSHQILPYRAKPSAEAAWREGAFTVAVLGAGRADKAFWLLPEVVSATHARDTSVQFRIQRPAPNAGLADAARQLERRAGVTLLPPYLEDAAYEAELQRAHVVLLAYDTAAYARRGSGVFLDAVMFARPLVCVSDTALARALRGNGVIGQGPVGLAQAIVTAHRCHFDLAVAARDVRDDTFASMRDGPLLSALNDGQA